MTSRRWCRSRGRDDGLPCVDVSGCSPREVVRRVAEFIDELHAAELRAVGTQLILTDCDCEAIVVRLSLLRIELLKAKTAHLEAVVQVLEDLRKENDES